VAFPKTKSGKYKAPKPETLRENGATEEETAFLIGDGREGRRIELNAMTSDQFVASVKAILEANGLNKKVDSPPRGSGGGVPADVHGPSPECGGRTRGAGIAVRGGECVGSRVSDTAG